MKMISCVECGKETDVDVSPSTYCSTCGMNFCSTLDTRCFCLHHRKSGCRGCAITVTNPQWTVKLVKPSEK